MVGSFSSNARRPSVGSWLANWFSQRPHPDSFICGVRVVDGEVAGETRRWSYRRSAVDPLVTDGVITLNHGDGQPLRIRMDDSGWDGPGPGPRSGFVIAGAVEVVGNGRLLIAAPPGELVRFGLDAL